jgi:uncharacterized membrane protein YdjX (TVP38/TMEM64 family)
MVARPALPYSDAMEGPPRSAAARRFVPLGILLAALLLFFAFGGHRYVSFAALAENREWLAVLVARAGATAALVFILVYAGLVAISVPGATLLTITSGFLFGPWLGTAYAVTGATLGATIAFLAARAGFAGLAGRAGQWAQRIEAGFRADGLSYLLVLRLIPLFPFWLVNLVAGAAGLRLSVFVLGTVAGIIPVTFIFASLGNGLGALIAEGRTPDSDILLDPRFLLPIIGLAVFALLPVAYKSWRRSADREAM